MMHNQNQIPFYFLKGTYREIGAQYGQAARREIQQEAHEAFEARIRKAPMGQAKALRLLDQFRADYVRYAPHILDEIEGVAAGAGIKAEEALLLRCVWDMAPTSLTTDGCTSFVVGAKRTAGGILMGGQNKDIPPQRINRMVILAIHPEGGAPATLNFAYYGMCEGPGFNSRGLMRFENSLFLSIPNGPTVPMHLLKRLFTESGSITECVEWVKRIRADGRLGFSGSLTFGESSGRMATIELAPGDFRVVEASDAIMAHANDPLDSDFKQLDMSPTDRDWSDSVRRTARMEHMLRAGRPLDLPYLQHCLCDHKGRPSSICRHRRQSRTICAMVAVPSEGILWATRGNPCRNPFLPYSIHGGQ